MAAAKGVLEQEQEELISAKGGPRTAEEGRKIRWNLYCSHSLARWGRRMWEFTAVLVLVQANSGSLRLVAICGVLQAAAISLLAPLAGWLVDHTDRQELVISTIVMQNAAVLVAALIGSFITLRWWNRAVGLSAESTEAELTLALSDTVFFFAASLVMALRTLASLAELCRTVAMERDWVVEISSALSPCGTSELQPTGRAGNNNTDSRGLPESALVKKDTDFGKQTQSSAGSLGDEVKSSLLIEGGGESQRHESASAIHAESLEGNGHGVLPLAESASIEKAKLLAGMNATMARIDLVCRLAAPALTGILMALFSMPVVCLAVACWNLATFPAEVWLIHEVHSACPALEGSPCSDELKCSTCATPSLQDEAPPEEASSLPREEHRGPAIHGQLSLDGEPEVMAENSQGASTRGVLKKWLRRVSGHAKNVVSQLRVYFKQPSLCPGLSLALLYFTVLSFGDVMTAYLKAAGVPVLLLGLLSATSAITGLAGTLVYPVVHQRFGLLQAGLMASGAQWVCLLPSAIGALVVAGRSPVPPWLLVGSVVLSRLGLWMFDIAALQVVQESVVPQERGQVGGMQHVLQQVLQGFSFIMCIFIDKPLDFWIPVVASFSVTTVASGIYASFFYAQTTA